ncbi:phosphatase PAP2 family protein (plasmid) [Novosphingobium sp. BL-8A]|uniref:phosphatase PAP2 family protein n=1 Tax=Novosphingobium sp. BL-8A TaxID=3127639 RepID=UPI0037563964
MAATGQAQSGYLSNAPLPFALPAPPDEAATSLESTIVQASQKAAGGPQADEAVMDAQAFEPAQPITRFTDAARAPLIAEQRPVLVAFLGRALGEVATYSGTYKNMAERARLYVEEPAIPLCYDNPRYPLDPKRSYPSGHAANGYAAALVLAEIFPARREEILARGLRYGDNRVVCGAHHPSDVLEGQLLAVQYFKAASLTAAFREALDCAHQEEAVIEKKLPALPAGCATRKLK